MKILCDENVPSKYVNAIAGLSCTTVLTVESELGMGASDSQVRNFAEKKDCVVLTNDKDFLLTKYADDHGLLYIFQNRGPSPSDVATAVDKIESAYTDYESVDEIVPGGWA